MSKKSTAKNPIKPEVTMPSMEELQMIFQQLIMNFINEEQGNKVTNNNMAGLQQLLSLALAGKITTKQPQGQAPGK